MAMVRAIYHALDLLDRPILAGVMQEQPLPPDTLTLLRIVAGDEVALGDTALATAQAPRRVHRAAILYVQRVLFAPDASHYRVLGARRDAPQEELRERLGLLMRWLHPDRTGNDWESTFARRVLAAWDALKTAERRRDYDATLPKEFRPTTSRRTRRPRIYRPARRIPWIATEPTARTGTGRRMGLIVLGSAIAIGVLVVPDWAPAPQQVTAAGSNDPTDVVIAPADGGEQRDPTGGGS